jgi:hypothetical protein
MTCAHCFVWCLMRICFLEVPAALRHRACLLQASAPSGLVVCSALQVWTMSVCHALLLHLVASGQGCTPTCQNARATFGLLACPSPELWCPCSSSWCLQIVYTRFTAAPPSDHAAAPAASVQCDVTSAEDLLKLLRQRGPFAAVINTVAISQPGSCQLDPDTARSARAHVHRLPDG